MRKKAVIEGKVSNCYLVDEEGNIYNIEGHLMAQHLSWNGYLRVKLCRDVKRKMYLVHRIVAETFIPNPNNYPLVNHLDNTDRTNNNVSNLEWNDNSGNQIQRYKQGYKGTKCKPVAQIDAKTNTVIKVFGSPIYAERELGINHVNICKVANGDYGRKTAGGYKWKWM